MEGTKKYPDRRGKRWIFASDVHNKDGKVYLCQGWVKQNGHIKADILCMGVKGRVELRQDLSD